MSTLFCRDDEDGKWSIVDVGNGVHKLHVWFAPRGDLVPIKAAAYPYTDLATLRSAFAKALGFIDGAQWWRTHR